jgi:hypothetical protein
MLECVSKNRRRWMRFAALMVLLTGLFLWDYPPAWATYWNWSISHGLPPGSTRYQTERWLNRHGFHHGYFDHPDETLPSPLPRFSMDMIGHDTVAERAGVNPADVSGYVHGGIYCTGPISQWYTWHVYFFFDHKGRLIKHSIEVLGSGMP